MGFIKYSAGAFEGGARSYAAQGICSFCRDKPAEWMRDGKAYCKECKNNQEAKRMDEPVKVEVGATGTLAGEEYTVKESCGTDHGRWACLTHDVVFTNQLMKDCHLGSKIGNQKAPCTLAWICFEHGVERP